jgi:hypothetical protein
MSTVLEIEQAITKLSPDEMRSVAGWLVSRLPSLNPQTRQEIRRQACGIWKDRTDLPAVGTLRAEWNSR